MAQATAPPGWPRDLAPPVSEEFPTRVTGWLLDRGPQGLRERREWRKFPQALALVVGFHTEHTLLGLREAYSAARRELVDRLDPGGLDEVLVALEAAGSEAAETARQVSLVAEAMDGKRWKQRL